MSTDTKIEWTDATWNPIRGCTRVSEGCRFCYAEAVAARFSGPGLPYEGLARKTAAGPRWTGLIQLVEEHLGDPLRWQKPRRVFVNSMSDLFHEGVPDDYIAAVFGVMGAAPRHTFQLLTKRPHRMREWLSRATLGDCSAEASLRLDGWRKSKMSASWPLPNVWIGVSVEDQKAADERIPLLLRTPAAVRFLSCEPLLGAVDLIPWLDPDLGCEHCDTWCDCPHSKAVYLGEDFDERTGHQPFRRVDWVIAGGESGEGTRFCDLTWLRQLRDQAQSAKVPFFLKQLGGARDKRGGDAAVLDGARWTQFPQVPAIAPAGGS